MSKLILLPNLLSESTDAELYFPLSVKNAVQTLNGLIAESEKEGRRFLRKFVSHEEMAKTPIKLLNEHTDPKELQTLIEPILRGETWGLISDAGLPCLADPGSDLVKLLRLKNIEVVSMGGTSSIILALQLSGFNGQSFSFYGYLPKEEAELIGMLKKLEGQKGATHIWIEAPYRTDKMITTLLSTLKPDTRLCVAVDLQGPQEKVVVDSIAKWKEKKILFGKVPAVFLIS